MAKKYIIDGYNLGYVIPEIADKITSGQLQLAIAAICARVSSLLKNRAAGITLVFDGRDQLPASLPPCPGLRVRFSHKPQTADDLIRVMIRKVSMKKNWIVVTSDREILGWAKDHGLSAMQSRKFLNSYSTEKSDSASDKSLAKEKPETVDMEYWLKLFGEK